MCSPVQSRGRKGGAVGRGLAINLSYIPLGILGNSPKINPFKGGNVKYQVMDKETGKAVATWTFKSDAEQDARKRNDKHAFSPQGRFQSMKLGKEVERYTVKPVQGNPAGKWRPVS